MKNFNNFLKEKNGLWANIHAKRKRGEKPNPPGHPDRPSAQDFKDAQKTSTKENYVSHAQRKAVWAARNDEKEKANEAKDGDGANIVRDREFKEPKFKFKSHPYGSPEWHANNAEYEKFKAKQAAKKAMKREGVEEGMKSFKDLREELSVALDEISKDLMGRYFDKADASHKKALDARDRANKARYGKQATKDKHSATIKKRIKGIGSVLKRDFARTTGQDYITKPSKMDAIKGGDKGHSMTTKRSDQLHKNYKDR